jgi:hypothetical protein
LAEAGKAAPITPLARHVNRFTVFDATECLDAALITQAIQSEREKMRAILVLIGLAAVVVVILMSLGMLNLQMQSGSFPTVTVNTKGGELPKVKAETGSIGLGTTNTTVQVPTVEMKKTTVTTPTIDVKPAAKPTPAP